MRWKAALTVVFSLTVLALASYGIHLATRSSLFLVQVVEVSDLAENAPVDAQAISDLAAVPIGKVNLFDFDLKPVEARILANHWIREVHLQKRFPQTVAISVVFRDPQAFYQSPRGELFYVDSNGAVFGRANLVVKSDLPVISGDIAQLPAALKLLGLWEKTPSPAMFQISSLDFDPERGFRALVTYPLSNHQLVRAMVDLGQKVDADLEAQVPRLEEVLNYLSNHSVAARQIWADAGKKIVVKITRGS